MSPGRGRRRGGCLVAALLVLVVLVAAFIGGDRWAAHEADKQVATRVREQLKLSEDPQVDFTGFPFLTQAARNRFDRVDVVAHGLGVQAAKPLTVGEVRLQLSGVNTSENYSKAVADTVQGTATVDWSELEKQIGVPLQPSDDGRVLITIRPRVMGQSTTVTVSGRPVVDAATKRLTFTDLNASVAKVQVPQEVLQPIVREYLPSVPLELPMGLRATGVRVEQAHAVLELAGEQVRLSG